MRVIELNAEAGLESEKEIAAVEIVPAVYFVDVLWVLEENPVDVEEY